MIVANISMPSAPNTHKHMKEFVKTILEQYQRNGNPHSLSLCHFEVQTLTKLTHSFRRFRRIKGTPNLGCTSLKHPPAQRRSAESGC